MMSTNPTANTATTSAVMASTEPSDPTSGIKTVIWGLVYKQSFKNVLRASGPVREKEPAGKAAQPASDEDEEEAPPAIQARVKIRFDKIPPQEFTLQPGATSFGISLGVQARVDVDYVDSTGHTIRNASSSSRPVLMNATASTSGGSKKSGPSRKVPKVSAGTPRISVGENMEWVPITQNGQPYLNHDNRDASKVKIGPSVRLQGELVCNFETDIFVVDRNFLYARERPKDCDKVVAINLFVSKETERGQKARRLTEKDEILLHQKNVALNVNDPGTMLIYFDLLVTAYEAENFVNDFSSRTITFFSGPEHCDHADCAAMRFHVNKNFRAAGAKNILSRSWWTFAEFCFHESTATTFTASPHSHDLINHLDPEEASQVRTWYHSFLNHPPTGTANGVRCTEISVYGWTGMNPGPVKFHHLIDEMNDCVNAGRAGEDREYVGGFIDPVVSVCLFCKGTGFGVQHFTKTMLPKREDTGLMYLHYGVDSVKNREEEGESYKGKGKERANYALEDGAAGSNVGFGGGGGGYDAGVGSSAGAGAEGGSQNGGGPQNGGGEGIGDGGSGGPGGSGAVDPGAVDSGAGGSGAGLGGENNMATNTGPAEQTQNHGNLTISNLFETAKYAPE
ncbi:uncharacterized protein GGS22DRAFT_194043 [Annulohypoxylon maeteangense]|uniref:uncharacterized protein n=1 Tax=Annulohypoxylon maeteangense TaxID=1927788 RepID=UPI00200870BD|nr:uncharacterized protein GGS22DRAFT_194043 [Annulohypoxylon maeteangense]KAI0889643.1 hypothetical protein GGS22DRAFT_194043 [Annulohypoxylon maeteangense]